MGEGNPGPDIVKELIDASIIDALRGGDDSIRTSAVAEVRKKVDRAVEADNRRREQEKSTKKE